jgi:hypothetical protein
VLRTSDAGEHWTRLETGTTNYLYGVACTDAQTAFVVGENGTILRTTNAMLDAIADETLRAGGLPPGFRLEQNYPNPFNPVTWIRYTLPEATPVSLRVYNLLGEEVRVLVDAFEGPGTKTVKFDATGLASGVYYYRLRAGSTMETHTLLLLR